MFYNIECSRPRRRVKELFGQANHFLITSLVGLDYLSKNDVKCPESFSTVWDPRDKANSIERSRGFLLGSFLASSVDALDSYFFLINRNPKLIPVELQTEFDSKQNARSVFNKFVLVYNKYCDVVNIRNYGALVAMSIKWRNNLIHFNSSDSLDAQFINVLNSDAVFFEQQCSGLDVSLAIDHFLANKTPTFKEIASIISSTHRFIQELDHCLIADLDLKEFAFNVLSYSWDERSRVRLKSVSKARAIGKIANKLVFEGFNRHASVGLGKSELEYLYDRLIGCFEQ